jgi:hypothetical protein
MARLEELGLRDQWIYEVLVSTLHEGMPHAAPMGVWSPRPGSLAIDAYEGSRTLESIMQTGCFAANFPPGVDMLYAARHAPGRLGYEEALIVHVPVLAGCSATVELTLASAVRDGEKVRITGEVQSVRHEAVVRLINRAEGLLLESLVLASRAEHRGSGATLRALTENHRVIAKVAPASDYEQALAALIREIGAGS